MNIADRIQNLRKMKGISQEELADKIGVSRQAVSKWESEQNTPDIEKILLLSDYFEVTTDYLLKGVEPKAEATKAKPDARIFMAGGTAINFIGLVTEIMLWRASYNPNAVAIGLIFMTVGCLFYALGQFIGEYKKEAAKWFAIINVWFLCLMPFSIIFNAVHVWFGRGWGGRIISPIPLLNDSLRLWFMCWVFYIVFCILVDIVILLKYRRK